MKVLIILAMALGISFSTGPEEVPTSLCHDPLLGPSMIIYSDCSSAQEVPDKDHTRKIQQPTVPKIEPPINQIAEQLTDDPDIPSAEQQAEELSDQPKEQSVEPLSEIPNTQSAEQVTELPKGQSTEKSKGNKEKCNKGSGNGGEGCDPGNHPEKGNNDEGGDRHPQDGKNDNPEKKQNCNKGSGNGAEGCDPGKHPEKGNNDEGGDRAPQNSKKYKAH